MSASKRVRAHLRANVVGYIALFLVVSGGTAYATHPGGDNTIDSRDIINGEVRNIDIRTGAVNDTRLAANSVTGQKVVADALTGADVDEASLDYDCPDGFSPAGDICFDDEVTPGTQFAAAETACQDAGLRLPSVGEARLIQVALGPTSGTQVRFLWADDHTGGTTAMAVFQNSVGTINPVSVTKTNPDDYTCVRAPVRP